MGYLLANSILIAIYSILALSLNYITGYTGLLSLSHAAFFGIGAYTTAILTSQYDYSFITATLGAVAVTAIVASLASTFILKLKDDSLMLVSFGFSIIVYNILLNWTSLTNGALGIKGIPTPIIFGVDFFDRYLFLGLAIVIATFTYLIFNKIVKSPYGRILKGIRENETVMQNSGHNTSKYKHSAFILGSTFAALAGSLIATNSPYTIMPNAFELMESVLILIIIITGGLANMRGAILGTIIILIFPEVLKFTGIPQSIMAETRQILYGVLLIVLMYYRPQGVLGKYKV